MDKRLETLIEYIQEHQPVPYSQTADYMGISQRTLRNWVRSANSSLSDVVEIASKRGEGYLLKIHDQQAFQQLMSSPGSSSESTRLPSSPEERQDYLLNDLLWRDDWITIDELASVLYVSRRTTSKDLAVVEKTLSNYGLSLVSRPYSGIKVVGSEQSRRICLASVVASKLSFGSEQDLHPLVSCVSEALSEALDASDLSISLLSYQNLVVHLTVAVRRIQTGRYISLESERLNFAERSFTYKIAEDVADGISRRLGIQFPDQEISYIALHLAARRIDYLTGGKAEAVVRQSQAGMPLEDREAWEIVSKMLERVQRIFHYDFKDDLELRMNLVQHVEPLMTRLRFNLSTPNPLLSEIKEKYSLAYQFADESAVVLNERLGVTTSEQEVGYLALDFAVALERKRTAPAKKNILIVCSSGVGSARLLEVRFSKLFGSYINRITTCDVLGLKQQDFQDIDYVFTTVPIPAEIEIPVPVRQIGFFFDDSDEGNLIVHDLRLATGKPTQIDWQDYFPQDLFFPNAGFSTKSEALESLCARMEKALGLDSSFSELVWAREQAASTSFGNLVAMPHPITAVSSRTAASVALLEHPIDWGGHSVQAIFLITVTCDPSVDLGPFYQALTYVFSSKELINTLLAHRDYETLLDILSQGAAARKDS